MLARDVIRQVSNDTGVAVREIMGNARHPRIVRARHLCQWIIHKRLGYSLLRTARMFGRRNHTSVIYAVRHIEALSVEHDDIRKWTDASGNIQR